MISKGGNVTLYRSLRCLAAACVFVCFALGAWPSLGPWSDLGHGRHAWAQDASLPQPPFRSQTVTMPQETKDSQGFTVQFTWDGLKDPGYATVGIAVVANSTFTADRRLSLRMVPSKDAHGPPQSGLAIELPIPVDQGKKRQTFVRRIPKWSFGDGYELRVFEDGSELKGYDAAVGTALQRRTRPPRDLLWRDTELNVLRHKSDDKQQTFELPDLPTDWRSFQASDLVMIGQDALQELAAPDNTQYTPQFKALRDWLIMGGTIVVTQCDSISSVAKTMDVADTQNTRLSANTLSAEHQTALNNWQSLEMLLKFEQKYNSLSEAERATKRNDDADFAYQEDQLSYNSSNGSLRQFEAAKVAKSVQDKLKSRTHLRLLPVMAGQIITVHSDTQLNEFTWQQIRTKLLHRQSPMLRRGVDPMLGDTRAKRSLIPGVSEPPVYTFMSLLTLFVILVGPVAYRYTTKSGRGYLMLAIAPVLALITTAALLAYGIIADGFGTQSRIRQVTWVDGQSGDAFDRVRATYFAGLQPRDGIRFPADAEVMHYPDREDGNWQTLAEREHRVKASVLIDEDTQQFDSRVLPSRTQQQFVVHQPLHNLGALEIVPFDESRITVNNSFAFDLRSVVIRDKSGKYWLAQQLDGNQDNLTASLCLPSHAAKQLGRMFIDNALIANPGAAQGNHGYSNRTRDLIVATNRKSGNLSPMVDGIAEDWLQLHMQLTGELPRGTFAALSDVSEDAVWIKDADRVLSVRFVFGTLR